MSPSTTQAEHDTGRDLVLNRLIDAPPDAVFAAWTTPDLLVQWFAPRPWSTPRADLDVRPGGGFSVVMADPDGNEFPNSGVYLEVVPGKTLVFTDAYTGAWVPSEKPFFTCILTFEPEGGKTRYGVRACHWTREDREAHEAMGFHEGWGQCADQLEAVLRQNRG